MHSFRRHLIGAVALLSLAAAGGLTLWPVQAEWAETFRAGFYRGGTLAAIVWLAYADMRRMPAWVWGALLAVLVVVAVRPRTILIAIPIIVALAILKPRFGTRR